MLIKILVMVYFLSLKDDQEPKPETLLSRSIVQEFYAEMAKLKSLGVLHKVRHPCTYKL